MRLIDIDKVDLTEWLDKQPTVDAIPVELIYKIRNLYLKNDCIISAGVCNEILNMWRKENETY